MQLKILELDQEKNKAMVKITDDNIYQATLRGLRFLIEKNLNEIDLVFTENGTSTLYHFTRLKFHDFIANNINKPS